MPKKVLIIEDHPDMQEVLLMQMERIGFSAIVAKNDKEGVEKCLAEKPDLILMDIMMPVMDGIEAARAIRSSFEIRNIPILAITALYKESELESCLEAGCNDYIIKPYTMETLKEKVKKLVPSLDAQEDAG